MGAGRSGAASSVAGWLRKCLAPCGLPFRMLGETSFARSQVVVPSLSVRLTAVRSQTWLPSSGPMTDARVGEGCVAMLCAFITPGVRTVASASSLPLAMAFKHGSVFAMIRAGCSSRCFTNAGRPLIGKSGRPGATSRGFCQITSSSALPSPASVVVKYNVTSRPDVSFTRISCSGTSGVTGSCPALGPFSLPMWPTLAKRHKTCCQGSMSAALSFFSRNFVRSGSSKIDGFVPVNASRRIWRYFGLNPSALPRP